MRVPGADRVGDQALLQDRLLALFSYPVVASNCSLSSMLSVAAYTSPYTETGPPATPAD